MPNKAITKDRQVQPLTVDVKSRTLIRPQRVRLFSKLSCITGMPNVSGGWQHVDMFDVREELPAAGNLTGVQIAGEVLQAELDHPDEQILKSVIEGAVRELSRPQQAGKSRRGAAIGFLEAICEVTRAAACDGIAQESLRRQFTAHEAYAKAAANPTRPKRTAARAKAA